MWEYQDKFAAKQRRMRRDSEARRRRGKKDEFHLYRVPIEIRIERGGLAAPKLTLSGRLLSTELSSTSMEFFTTHRLAEGELVSINIKDGSRLYIRAIVQECKRYRLSPALIQEFPHPFRVRVEFDFRTQEEAQSIAQFAETFFAMYVAGGNKRTILGD